MDMISKNYVMYQNMKCDNYVGGGEIRRYRSTAVPADDRVFELQEGNF